MHLHRPPKHHSSLRPPLPPPPTTLRRLAFAAPCLSRSPFSPLVAVTLSSDIPPRTKCTTIPKAVQSNPTTRNPVVIFPGLANAAVDYVPLAEKLRQRHHPSVTIVPIRRWQWTLNARAFFTRDYWTGTLSPSPFLDWYFARVHSVVEPLMQSNPDQPINFLAHSAGGWLARLYLAQHAPPNIRIASFVTLGTPHLPPPSGIPDQTRGLLRYVAANCPPPSSLTCVAGVGVRGAGVFAGSWRQLVAYLSYAAVCGEGGVDGDGVTPACAAVLPGAFTVECRCAHSMLTDAASWYGCDGALHDWVHCLL